MSNQSNSTDHIISLPQGGGALSGIGEKFSPDLHTGTGNFSVPIALPPGRNGFQPKLNLVYSTGNGNGPFGLGWSLSIPGVSRKTSAGVPLYNESTPPLQPGERRDVFILSGAEDLVPVSGSYPGAVVYRPRTEGLFARITHHQTPGPAPQSYWRVESKDGLVSLYGSLEQADSAPTVLTKPGDARRIFAWKLAETQDPFGNRIGYEYETDPGERGNQLLLKRIKYIDYGDPAPDNFLVRVDLTYEDRPDPFSDYRAGFEIRTTQRCRAIKVSTRTADGKTHAVHDYVIAYATDSYNGVSLLQQIDIIGYDDDGNAYEVDDPQNDFAKLLPPLTFGYTRFEPKEQQFEIVDGRDLPARALGAPDVELVDLHGSGLPDILEMNGTVRYWRNLGHSRFDMPRPMQYAPPHTLADPGVQLIDANGDGRMDLLVTSGPLAGYYPLTHSARWDAQSFQHYPCAPTFNLDDPEVKLVDLDGDGYTDILRSGNRLECFFNDPDPALAWQRTNFAPRQTLDAFPNINFSDPRVRLADMNGDGLQDIVLIHDGNVEYWPNLGHNHWGEQISMRHAPRYRDIGYELGYDPRRILVGDVDGDGLADIVYVGNDQVLLWINQSGNAWSQEPIVVNGTPPVTDLDNLRLIDLNGTGVSGVLWSSDATSLSRHRLMFLDFTGGRKPYVLNEMDNHMGAITRVEYKPSTFYFLEDAKRPATRWRTPLPFPVQVVAKVQVIDEISRGKLTTEYRYHHGYWDGAEREFRGFGMVEQLDTETFADYHAIGLHGDLDGFEPVPDKQFSRPTLTKTWFHQGPAGEEFGDWQEADYTREYWPYDPQLLGHTEQVNEFLRDYNDRPNGRASPRVRRIKRDALRTLRGSILRTELYALDGSPRQDRPYTVAEHAYNLEEIDAPARNTDRKRIFFPHLVAQRTTQWERGDDPMTQFAFTGDYDDYGQPQSQTAVAMPRLAKQQRAITGAVVGSFNPNETRVLASHSRTEYASPPTNDLYIHDRVAQIKTYELANPQPGPDDRLDDLSTALRKQWAAAQRVRDLFDNPDSGNAKLIGHQIHHYDGLEFEGLAVGQLGDRGALIRSEALVFTGKLLDDAYGDRRPNYLDSVAALPAAAPSVTLDAIGYRKQPLNASPDNAAYYTDTLRQRISARGLPLVKRDSLRNEIVITYDAHGLLPVQVLDPAGLETSAAYNYRLLKPSSLTEPNGSSTHIVYNAIGLPHKQYIVGLDAQGRAILGGTAGKSEITFAYDWVHFARTKKRAGKGLPIFVHTTRRIHHASDNLSDDPIESREYSDGYGRLMQTRAQAEAFVFGELGGEVGLTPQPGSAPSAAIGRRVDDSIVASGWQVFNNKGRVVEKYEPFFSRGWEFQPEQEAKKGEHATLFYDPRGQVIRTSSPDGSQQRVIFGQPRVATDLDLTQSDLESTDVPSGFEPTPWEIYTYDANDLADLTHHGASRADASHHFTPANITMDALGRVRCQIERNSTDLTDWFTTRSDYDMRGNLLRVTDALGREAFRYCYDLLNRTLAVNSIDAGRRTSVFDALGNLIEFRDSKGSLVRRTYDQLKRPKDLWARDNDAGRFTLRERIIYGDEGDRDAAKRNNTLGRPVQHYDEAGLLEMPQYDFKGNLLEKLRHTIKDDALANDWLADWSASNPNNNLETNVYQTSTRYDALNRPIEITYPQDVEGQRKKLTPRYNRAGALDVVKLGNDDYVRHIAYNAKGQRVLIAYGNEIMTRYAYDARTFRLIRLRTERFAHAADPAANTQTWSGAGQVLQDCGYGYDLAGNIPQIDEHMPNCGIANSTHGRDRLLREFSYDPTYRLLSATGRACKNIGVPRGLNDDPRCGFFASGTATPNQDNAPDLTEHYTERFDYDPAGNMLALRYDAASGQWTRRFGMSGFTPKQWADNLSASPSGGQTDWGNEGNRLTNFGDENQARNHLFDANGNLIRQNADRHHTWDHADRMIAYRVQPNAGSPASIQARYLYGADGMRVKKWVRASNGSTHDASTVYIDGLFEHHRWQKNGGGENNNIHIIDNQSRIALVRVGSPHPDDKGERVQYHLSDHIGSSSVVVGGDVFTARAFLHREEYFAYGETSLGSFARKRYRYSGKERDEESGLYYFGARYYAPWLARWVSCDPAGLLDGTNIYRAFTGNPITRIDRNGTSSEPSGDEEKRKRLEEEIKGASPNDAQLDELLEAERQRRDQLGQELLDLQQTKKQAGERGMRAKAEGDSVEAQEAAKTIADAEKRITQLEEEIRVSENLLSPVEPETPTTDLELTPEESAAAELETDQVLEQTPGTLTPAETAEAEWEAMNEASDSGDDASALVPGPWRIVRMLAKEVRKDSPMVTGKPPEIPLDPHGNPLDLGIDAGADLMEWALGKIGVPIRNKQGVIINMKDVDNIPEPQGWGEAESPGNLSEHQFLGMRLQGQ